MQTLQTTKLVKVGKGKMLRLIVVTTTAGAGIPGKDFPKRCLRCLQKIHVGQAWFASNNSEYTVIQHAGSCPSATCK